MNLPPIVQVAACAFDDTKGDTTFSRLSAPARDLIVRAAMGEFDSTPPPAIPEDVQAELAVWAAESPPHSHDQEDTPGTRGSV